MSNFWKKKKVFVTGADGFIGSHLVERLVQNGASVRAFVLYNSFGNWGWLESFQKRCLQKIDVYPGDVRDAASLDKALGGSEIVFHLASLIAIPYSYSAPESYLDTNVKGTLNILQAVRKHGVRRVIHTSTSEVYGTAQYVPIDEQHPLNPQSPYAASKSAADALALSFYHSFGVPVVIARPFNTFGPRQSARAVIPAIISQIYAGKKTIELGSLAPTRDFNYIANTVDAFLALGEASAGFGEVFNIGSGGEISIGTLVSLIQNITGSRVNIRQTNMRKRPVASEVQRLLCNADKIKNYCGWQPEVALKEGLTRTCKWIQQNREKFKPEIYHT